MSLSLYLYNYDDVRKKTQNDDGLFKENYTIRETKDGESTNLNALRLRHFFRTRAILSSIHSNSGIKGYTGSGIEPVTASYNTWRVPGRPPRIDVSVPVQDITVSTRAKRFDTEISIRFTRDGIIDKNNPTRNNADIWFKHMYRGEDQAYDITDITSSFSFVPYNIDIESSSHKGYHNPMNILFEKKRASYAIEKIETVELGSDVNQISKVKVTLTTAHNLSVGDAVTIYDGGQICDTMLFSPNAGERIFGDFKISELVPNDNKSFYYTTYHNVSKVKTLNTITGSNLVCEIWELCVYEDNITSISSGNNRLILTLETPSDGGYYNFEFDDYITVVVGGKRLENARVIDFDYINNTVEIEYFGSVGEISGTGVIYYTPRLPSTDIPVNYHNSIVSGKATSHINNTRLLYAMMDTFCDYTDLSSINGKYSENGYNETNYIMKCVRNKKVPLAYFPVPGKYNTTDNDVIAEVCFCGQNAEGGHVTLLVGSLDSPTYTWDENTPSSSLQEHINVNAPEVGNMSSFSFGNESRKFRYTYSRFDLDTKFITNMLNNTQSSSIFVYVQNDEGAAPNFNINYYSREAEEEWPYMIISAGVFVETKPVINLYDTYMYYPCTYIGPFDSHTCRITVHPGVKDPSSDFYVRSGNFFEEGDEIEILNTITHDTSSATIVYANDYDDGLELIYSHPNPYDAGYEYSAIIRNKTKMLSSYTMTVDKLNVNPDNIHTTPDVLDKYVYRNDDSFDLKHTQDNILRISAIGDSGVESDSIAPIILTNVDIRDLISGDKNRFQYVSEGAELKLSGLNFNQIRLNGSTPYVVLGDPYWEDGKLVPTQELLTRVGDSDSYKFVYKNSFELQYQNRVIDLKNENGITWFRLDDMPYETGSIVTLIASGTYAVNNTEIPSFPTSDTIPFTYGDNYYCWVKDDWVAISYSYISRFTVDESSFVASDFVHLSDDEVAKYKEIYDVDELAPFVMYNPITSLEYMDETVNTGRAYNNRMYIQIDEYSPLVYTETTTHLLNEEYDVYVSDLNGVVWPNSNLVSVTYLNRDNDTRYVKLTYKETSFGEHVYTFSDSAGNTTDLIINVPNYEKPIIDIEQVSVAANGEKNVLFRVYGSPGTLVNSVASSKTGRGVFVEGRDGSAYGVINPPTEISSITIGTNVYDVFYFTLSLTSLGEGIAYAYATNNVDATSDPWFGPIIFPEKLSCLLAGDIVTYEGLNLIEPMIETDDGASIFYELQTNDANWFTIYDVIAHDASKVSIKLANGFVGKKSLYLKWYANPYVSTIQPQAKCPVTLSVVGKPTIDMKNPSYEIEQNKEWVEPNDITAFDSDGNDISDNIVINGIVDTSKLGLYTITYYAVDGCGQKTETLTREVRVVTGCPIYIKTDKEVYGLSDNIVVSIDTSLGGLFNQNYLNNIVHFYSDDKDIIVTIISGTSDRRSLTVKNPGITGQFTVQVYCGEDNKDFAGCPWSNVTTLRIENSLEPDKDLELGKADKHKKSNSVSKFQHVNFNPIYTKDLAYSTFTITADENNLLQNVYTILLTNIGERLYDDEFGSNIENKVFDIMGDINAESKILTECINTIKKYEPRVSVDIEKSWINYKPEQNELGIILYIIVPRGSARKIELTFRR